MSCDHVEANVIFSSSCFHTTPFLLQKGCTLNVAYFPRGSGPEGWPLPKISHYIRCCFSCISAHICSSCRSTKYAMHDTPSPLYPSKNRSKEKRLSSRRVLNNQLFFIDITTGINIHDIDQYNIIIQCIKHSVFSNTQTILVSTSH